MTTAEKTLKWWNDYLKQNKTYPLLAEIEMQLNLAVDNEKQVNNLAIHGVSKSFASGKKAQITHCIKGHEFEIGEFVEIIDYNENDLWLAKSLERSEQQWYITEEEANVC